LRHPLSPEAEITALPVLPIRYRRARYGRDLDVLYGQVLIECCSSTSPTADSRCCADGLQKALDRLFCNEKLRTPLSQRGRPLRSISHYLLEASMDVVRDMGTYITALALRPALQGA